MKAGLPVPFTIGLRPIAEADWLRPDDRLPAYLDEKARLNALDRGAVFASIDGMEGAQVEAEAIVAGWLAAHSPRHDDRGEPDGRVPDSDLPPLLRAGMRTCEDLVLMRRAPAGWVLAAASLHFPSAWVLAEKIGRPLQTVHAPVPGFEAGTRFAKRIDRMFDHLRPDMIVERGNWSLHSDGALHLPVAKDEHETIRRDADRATLHRRAERQTLRRLPCGDILFTIDVTVRPVRDLPPAERTALAAHVRALDAPQRGYKGVDDAGRLARVLEDG